MINLGTQTHRMRELQGIMLTFSNSSIDCARGALGSSPEVLIR